MIKLPRCFSFPIAHRPILQGLTRRSEGGWRAPRAMAETSTPKASDLTCFPNPIQFQQNQLHTADELSSGVDLAHDHDPFPSFKDRFPFFVLNFPAYRASITTFINQTIIIMLSSKLKFALAAAMTLSAAMPVAARAELPHEKLHRFLFGDDDRDYEKRKERRRHDRDDRRHHRKERRHSRHNCHDHNRNGYCDVCGTRFTVVRPAPIRVYPQVRYQERRDYGYGRYDRYDRRPIEFDVQIALRREGYYRGPIDGAIGRGTRYAIREYQYDYGLPVTGRIDRRLIRSLGLR
jgi:hypothetical protein